MKIVNPQIKKLLDEIGELSTFAGAAAQSAAGEIQSPVAAPASPLTDELIIGYALDEQQDRGSLYRKAVERMEALVVEMKGLDVLVEEAVPAPAPSGTTLPFPPPAPVVEPPPAPAEPPAAAPAEPTPAEPAPAAPVEPAP